MNENRGDRADRCDSFIQLQCMSSKLNRGERRTSVQPHGPSGRPVPSKPFPEQLLVALYTNTLRARSISSLGLLLPRVPIETNTLQTTAQTCPELSPGKIKFPEANMNQPISARGRIDSSGRRNPSGHRQPAKARIESKEPQASKRSKSKKTGKKTWPKALKISEVFQSHLDISSLVIARTTLYHVGASILPFF